MSLSSISDHATYRDAWDQKLQQLEPAFRQVSSYSTDVLKEILNWGPLSYCIPKRFGGRFESSVEYHEICEIASYYSLPLGLTLGISGTLFLLPLSLYGQEALQARVFADFMKKPSLGGLMVTEPDFGTDVFGIQTSYTKNDGRIHIEGVKHWQGLTGLADYWLVAARRKLDDNRLARHVEFFTYEASTGGMEVQEVFSSLGLCSIPYGRTRLDLDLPVQNRLGYESNMSGVRIAYDTLHRSRFQMPTLAAGFIRRLVDESRVYTRDRKVFGNRLQDYDQVQYRLAQLQAGHTVCSAFCANVADSIDAKPDLTKDGLIANVFKAVSTDLMFDCAHSSVQLHGANGYHRDLLPGQGLADCRPFMIFEGSNDILYETIYSVFCAEMQKAGVSSLAGLVKTHELFQYAVPELVSLLDFSLGENIPQRKMVVLGRILARSVSLSMVQALREQDVSDDLVENASSFLVCEIERELSHARHLPTLILTDDQPQPSWWRMRS